MKVRVRVSRVKEGTMREDLMKFAGNEKIIQKQNTARMNVRHILSM
jgi:hypothetical protein